MSSIHSMVDGKQEDKHLHLPLLTGDKVKITAMKKFAVARYEKLGLTTEEAKSLVNAKPTLTTS